jgi:ssDNA-binding Zn-finger/Zn-ribbon topoisomerase 1
MTENEGTKEEKSCPRCALENIKSKLKRLSNDILQCVKCNWLESDVGTKLTEPFKCPRCAIEGIKLDLKNYPNHLLTCSNCQWLGKQIGGRLVESLI